MRFRTLLTASALLVAGASLGVAAQERVKVKGPADFQSVYASVGTHFDAGRFGKAYAAGKELVGLISARRGTAIREALPAAPPEYTKEPFQEPRNAGLQNNALLAMTAGVGNIIEQNYNGSGGKIVVTATADSPFVQMFNMLLTNPAMANENQELIKYGDVMAMLETQNQRKTLKLVLGNSMIEAKFPNHSDDFIFAMWDQAAIDVLSAAIEN